MKLPTFLLLERGSPAVGAPPTGRVGQGAAASSDADHRSDAMAMSEPGGIGDASSVAIETFAEVIARREPLPRDRATSDAAVPTGAAAPLDLPAFLQVLPKAGTAVAVAAGREPIMAAAVRRLADATSPDETAVSSRPPSRQTDASLRLPSFLAAPAPRGADDPPAIAQRSVGTVAALREGLPELDPSRSVRPSAGISPADGAIRRVDIVHSDALAPPPDAPAPDSVDSVDVVVESAQPRSEAEPAARSERALAAAMVPAYAPVAPTIPGPPPPALSGREDRLLAGISGRAGHIARTDIVFDPASGPSIAAPPSAQPSAGSDRAREAALVPAQAPAVLTAGAVDIPTAPTQTRVSTTPARVGTDTASFSGSQTRVVVSRSTAPERTPAAAVPTASSEAVKRTAEERPGHGSHRIDPPEPIRLSVRPTVEARTQNLIVSLSTLPPAPASPADPVATQATLSARAASAPDPAAVSVLTATAIGFGMPDMSVKTDPGSDALQEPVGGEAWEEQLGAQLSVMASGGGESEAVMKLAPEELGELEIRVVVRDGEATLQFGATNADARQAIEAAQPRLRELFASQGLAISAFSVFSSLNGNPQSNPRSGEGPQRSSRGGSTARAEMEVRVAARNPQGIVDLYA